MIGMSGQTVRAWDYEVGEIALQTVTEPSEATWCKVVACGLPVPPTWAQKLYRKGYGAKYAYTIINRAYLRYIGRQTR